MLTIWSFCFLGQVFVIKLAYVFEQPVAAFTLVVLAIFLALCFSPFHCFYMRARKDLMVVLYHIFISPFGIVRFKHFFLADVITSFVNPLKDIGFICAFFFSGKWLNSELPSTKDNQALLDYTLIVGFLPYWFRLA